MKNKRSYYIVFILFIFILSSCKIFAPQNVQTTEYLFFPPPPDTARIQFLTSIGSSMDIEKNQSKFNKFIFGEEKSKTISKPFGVEIRFGKIYVCDLGLQGIEIINLEEKTFEYFIPEDKGKLIIPVNCYIDESGYLYVADSGRKEIVIFDNDLKFIEAFSLPEKFIPQDVFVSDNKIWVANYLNAKVNVFSVDTPHTLLNTFPESNKGDADFLYQPKNLYVTNDKVYVSDFGSFDVKKYSTKGEYLSTIGGQGMTVGRFARPKGVAVDNEGSVYVIDAAFGNAQIFNDEGQVLLYFGNATKDSKGKGYMYMPAAVDINYEDLKYFNKFVAPGYKLKYIILVTNQYGPDKLNIYGRIEKISD